MKICYDTLDGVKLTRNGIFLKNDRDSYIYMNSCKHCGDPYLTIKCRPGNFCSRSCASIGKKFSAVTIKRMSEAKKGIATKHGACALNLAAYDTYAHRLWCDKTDYTYIKGVKVLMVGCVECGTMFVPKVGTVIHRIRFLENKETCESRFYCSDQCRDTCPIFWQHKYTKGQKSRSAATVYEYSIWHQKVLENANYKCEYCGKKATDAHHSRPKKLEPFFALDPYYGFACCEKCHYKYGHSGDCSSANIAKAICI